MHSSDNQLQLLLTADEADTQISSIASHVENCAKCQQRLQALSGEGRWTAELVDHLRQPSAADLTGAHSAASPASSGRRTLLLSHPSDALEDDVELDPVSLDFLEEPVHPELLGRLGRYDIEAMIGAGGMGVVLQAFDGDLHRKVAIKVLTPHLAHNAAARRRFAREAQAVAAVIHPHVIPIYNVEVEQKFPYLVMSLVDGPSLQAHVDAHGPLAIDVALRIAQQTAQGLSAAHAQGLIHRDVKPANILLDGNLLRVVLSDFGLARMVDDASMTRTGVITGTPHYMSPEQASGESIDCRSDLFSLGCVLWFMLTGSAPFRAKTAMGVLNKICHDSAGDVRQCNPQVPKPLAEIISRLLNKSADGRYQSAQEVEQALASCLADFNAGKYARPSPMRAHRLPTTWIAASLALLAVSSCSLWLLSRYRAPKASDIAALATAPSAGSPLPTTGSDLGNGQSPSLPPSPFPDPFQSLTQYLLNDSWYQEYWNVSISLLYLEREELSPVQAWMKMNSHAAVSEASVQSMNTILDELSDTEKEMEWWRELLEARQPASKGEDDQPADLAK